MGAYQTVYHVMVGGYPGKADGLRTPKNHHIYQVGDTCAP